MSQTGTDIKLHQQWCALHPNHSGDCASQHNQCEYGTIGCMGRGEKHFCEGNPLIPTTLIEGVGKNTPIETNDQGGSQSSIPYRLDLLDSRAILEVGRVLKEGADKYGPNNWRKIPTEDHLNHLLMHTLAWLAGDNQDNHLSHIVCRAMFALGVELQPKQEIVYSDD